MSVIEFYEKAFDEAKRLTENDNRHLVELYRKRFLYGTLIKTHKPKSILQIACGTGVHTKWICENYPEISVVATDLVPEHVNKIGDYPNLVNKLVWDCSKSIPNELRDKQFDLILVEGAWYHIKDRSNLINNIKKLNGKVVVIDWLSAWHDTTQRILQNKEMPADWKNPRPSEPFVFDTESDLDYIKNSFNYIEYNVKLFPVDLDTRFGYRDLNNVDNEQFIKYIDALNKNIGIYNSNQSFIMNVSEHGCYIIERT